MKLPSNYRKSKRLDTLVENKTVYSLNSVELNIFETHQIAENVLLDFNQPMLASMIRGKKVMHLREHDGFAFLPGESLMLPADELMRIDFPEATMNNPTKCLALTLDDEIIKEVVLLMNELRPKVDLQEWVFAAENFHFSNDAAIYQIINRIVYLCVEKHPSKDMFIEMMLKELLMRIVQSSSQSNLIQNVAKQKDKNRMAFIINYIRDHIKDKITIKELSKKACMSESSFYRTFKNEVGSSPNEFINEERLNLAASLLNNSERKINDVYMECGFNSNSYFNRAFKKKYKVTPTAYQNKLSARN